MKKFFEDLWKDSPWYIKALLLVGLPIFAVFFLMRKLGFSIADFSEARARTKADGTITQAESKVEKARLDALAAILQVEALKKEKESVKDKVDLQDSVDFHNSRPKK